MTAAARRMINLSGMIDIRLKGDQRIFAKEPARQEQNRRVNNSSYGCFDCLGSCFRAFAGRGSSGGWWNTTNYNVLSNNHISINGSNKSAEGSHKKEEKKEDSKKISNRGVWAVLATGLFLGASYQLGKAWSHYNLTNQVLSNAKKDFKKLKEGSVAHRIAELKVIPILEMEETAITRTRAARIAFVAATIGIGTAVVVNSSVALTASIAISVLVFGLNIGLSLSQGSLVERMKSINEDAIEELQSSPPSYKEAVKNDHQPYEAGSFDNLRQYATCDDEYVVRWAQSMMPEPSAPPAYA